MALTNLTSRVRHIEIALAVLKKGVCILQNEFKANHMKISQLADSK